jgi:four helix bundle protein
MFVSYEVSLELIRSLKDIVPKVARHDAELAKQLLSAANSVVLNLGEGRRRSGGDQKRFYGYAHGSASEVRAALDLADAWGLAGDALSARRTLDRLLGLLWGLTHPRQAPQKPQ